MHRQLLIMISIVFFTQTTWAQNGKHDRLDGKYLFETEAGCARCHGIDGKGQTSGLGFDTSILPDFTDCSFNSHEPREEWLEVVAEGGLESGLSDVMPAFGEALTAAQIEAIVDYLKSLCRENGWPQGELNFTRPQTTIKAYPANDAIMNLRYARDQEQPVYSNFVYMRRAGKRSEWDVSVPVMLKSGAAASRGFGDIELRFKHVLHDRVASSSILSGGLGVVLPTGKSAFGTGAGQWKVAPFLAAGKGFEGFSIQSSLKVETPLQNSTTSTALSFDFAFTVPVSWHHKSFFPALELSTARDLSAGANETTVLLTPQVYLGFIKHGHVAFSFGWQARLAGSRDFGSRLTAQLLWQYDESGLWW